MDTTTATYTRHQVVEAIMATIKNEEKMGADVSKIITLQSIFGIFLLTLDERF